MCKIFEQIIRQHRVGRHVCVQTDFICHSTIPSLLAWLDAKSDAIETMQTSLWWSNECFKALAPARALTSVIATLGGVASLTLLARFKTLQSCHLSCPAFRHLDLAPLQGLEQLTSLTLVNGVFANLFASRLTYLSLVSTEVSCTTGCSFCTSLTKLSMVQSRLNNADSKGLLACTALQGLHISEGCTLWADRTKDILQNADRNAAGVPLHISSLATLRRVLFTGFSLDSSAEILGVCKLPSINHLELRMSSYFSAGFELEHLSRVTHLSLRMTRASNSHCLELGFLTGWR